MKTLRALYSEKCHCHTVRHHSKMHVETAGNDDNNNSWVRQQCAVQGLSIWYFLASNYGKFYLFIVFLVSLNKLQQ